MNKLYTDLKWNFKLMIFGTVMQSNALMHIMRNNLSTILTMLTEAIELKTCLHCVDSCLYVEAKCNTLVEGREPRVVDWQREVLQ